MLYKQPSFLVVLTKIRSESERPETSQNEPKQAETTQNQPTHPTSLKKCKMIPNNPNFNIGKNLNFCSSFHFSNFEPKCPKFGILGQKIIYFLILIKFCQYPLLKLPTSNLKFIFENFEPKYSNLGVLGQKVLSF